MFNPLNPPFLVMPVTQEESVRLLKHEGFDTHTTYDDQILVSFQDGWTLPFTADEKKLVTSEPLLLLRNSGRITSEGSSSAKGFAHQFCKVSGDELPRDYAARVFPERLRDNWMLVPEGAAVVWLQYQYKTQYLGEEAHDSVTYYYGKLLICSLTIQKDSVPRLDKNADNLSLRPIQYRVEEKVLISCDWNTTDENPVDYLMGILSEKGLDQFKATLGIAIAVASSTSYS